MLTLLRSVDPDAALRIDEDWLPARGAVENTERVPATTEITSAADDEAVW